MFKEKGLEVDETIAKTIIEKEVVKKDEKKKQITSHVWGLTTDLIHPDTGEEIITIEEVQEVLDSYRSIKDYAYIIHDKDTYTEEDIKKDGIDSSKLGMLKPKHIHAVMRFQRAQEVTALAKWFGFEDKPNFLKNGVEKVHSLMLCFI